MVADWLDAEKVRQLLAGVRNLAKWEPAPVVEPRADEPTIVEAN